MKNTRTHTAFLRAAALLAAVLTLCPLLSACAGGKAPELETVRETFAGLIGASAEVNDIFFGPGLPVYDRETSSGDGNASYDEATKTYYWFIEDEKLGTVIKIFDNETRKYRYLVENKPADSSVVTGEAVAYTDADGNAHTFYPIAYDEGDRHYVYDENAPVYYDFVLLDSPYQTVEQIKQAAEKVYSSQYLTAVYSVIFDGVMTDDSVIYARYMEDPTVEDGTFFLKSNRFDPYFETQTTYDCATMTIVKPSNATRVTVELDATGRYIDREKMEVVTGTFKKTLVFVLENGEWRLDTPTY